MNEWEDLFGLGSIWDDPDWPSLADVYLEELREEREKACSKCRKRWENANVE